MVQYKRRPCRRRHPSTHVLLWLPVTYPCLLIAAAGVWTNTCCSHQLYGQEPNEIDSDDDIASGTVPGAKAAAVRKLAHELGKAVRDCWGLLKCVGQQLTRADESGLAAAAGREWVYLGLE